MLVGALCMVNTANSATTQSLSGEFAGDFHAKVSCRYLAYLPADYGTSRTAQFPLLVYLHGSGERGSDLSKLENQGPRPYAKAHPDFPFILISPQCGEGEWWDNNVLISILDHLEKKFRVDKSRVYLTGSSMGGYAVWYLSSQYPDRFAAIAPISGEGYDDLAAKYKNLWVWAFHGEKDTVVNPRGSTDMLKPVRAAGGEMELTTYPDAGHNAWTRTYANPDLYTWLLAHKKPQNAHKAPR